MRSDEATAAASDLSGIVTEAHNQLLAATATPSSSGPGPSHDLEGLIRDVAPLLDAQGVAQAAAQLRARVAGVGGIEELLADPTVTDILINGPGPVWVERAGVIQRSHTALDSDAIFLLIEKAIGPLGLRADRTSPVVDARLPDGSRLHVVLPPLAVDGPYVTIRRFGAADVPLEAFCGPPVAALLRWAVSVGMNIFVCGGTGAGKTTLLNALCHHLPAQERVVTVEDTAELRLPGSHVVRLETRPATPDGLPAQTVRHLVRAALRMRPDRLIVGEVRGPEALDLLQALNTGHEGGLSTCHANSPADGLRRLESLASMASTQLPLSAIREQISSAVDLVVQVTRGENGARHVASVAETATGAQTARRTRLVAMGDEIVAPPRRPPRRASRPVATPAVADPTTLEREEVRW